MSDSSGQRRPRPRATAEERDPQHARHSVSVDRGFAILERFSGVRASESIAEISEAVGLPRSSVHRYLQTLTILGLVEQKGTPRRRYRLTALAGAAGIVGIASTGLRAVAHPELLALRRSSGCTARLAVRLGLDALLVDQATSLAEGQRMLALGTRPGARISTSASALRQVLLADLDIEALPAEMRRKGRSARAGLDQVRMDGHATQTDSGDTRIHAIAVPVRLSDQQDAIAAIELIGQEPAVTLAGLEEHLDQLRAAALRLSPRIADLPWAQWRPYTRRPQP